VALTYQRLVLKELSLAFNPRRHSAILLQVFAVCNPVRGRQTGQLDSLTKDPSMPILPKAAAELFKLEAELMAVCRASIGVLARA
jgi:hypothetical protein